jgi:CheY-like chemotaxis protein
MMKRAAEESPGEPQIAATNLVMDDDQSMRELKLGAAGFLIKPLLLPELLSTVAQQIEGRVAV